MLKTLDLSISPKRELARDATLVLLGSFAIALFANVTIPLPFTPVPIAAQSHVALLLGALLGAKRGASAVFAFLMQGALGLPVFAKAGFGLAVLFGPTGGYLFGYLLGAYVVGKLLEKGRTTLRTFSAFAVGSLLIYALGAGYLATFLGLKKALLLGVAPFLIGDLIKTVLSMKALEWMRRG